MKTKITSSKGLEHNNAAIRRKPRRKQAERPPPQGISDAAMILARQVAHLGLAALGSGEMPKAHALRGLMAAMITVSSAVMDRPDVVSWFRSLADEIEAEDYGAQVRTALRQ